MEDSSWKTSYSSLIGVLECRRNTTCERIGGYIRFDSIETSLTVEWWKDASNQPDLLSSIEKDCLVFSFEEQWFCLVGC